MRSLLTHVEIGGTVLDTCGSKGGAIEAILSARGIQVITNDSNSRYVNRTDLVRCICSLKLLLILVAAVSYYLFPQSSTNCHHGPPVHTLICRSFIADTHMEALTA